MWVVDFWICDVIRDGADASNQPSTIKNQESQSRLAINNQIKNP
jgi:hypothetical protein